MVRRGGTVAAQRPAAGRLPVVDLRHRTARHYRARLDRRHAARSARGTGVRRRGQGQGHGPCRTKLENINDVFSRMHHGDIEGRIVLDLA